MAIDFVGGATANKAGATSGNTTIALNSGLTGGTGSAVAANDLVIAVFATASAANRTLSITDGTTAYTDLFAEIYVNGVRDTNLRAGYKFMGGTPDTATTFGPTTNTADGGAMAVYVFSGVDQTTPLDVAVVTATNTADGEPDPASITPTTSGAYVVAIAGGTGFGTQTYTSSDLTDFMTNIGLDTRNGIVGIGHIGPWTSGAVNPAKFGKTGGNTDDTWAAATIALRPAPSGVTVGAAAGSYAVTGAAATTKLGRKVAADAGSYAVTGNAASLEYGFKVAAAAASYAVSGQAATFLRTWRVAADAGSYAVTGTDATLSKGGGASTLEADAGSYSVTGSDAALKTGRIVAANSNSYAVIGQAATLRRGYPLTASAGSYTISGQAAGLLVGREVAAASGAYAVTGQAASLLLGREVAAAAGSYLVTGSDASLSILTVGQLELAADAGSYAVTGAPAGLVHAYQIAASAGSYAVSGQTVSLLMARELIASGAAYTITGQVAPLLHGRWVAADAGSYAVEGSSATLTASNDSGDAPLSRNGRMLTMNRWMNR